MAPRHSPDNLLMMNSRVALCAPWRWMRRKFSYMEKQATWEWLRWCNSSFAMAYHWRLANMVSPERRSSCYSRCIRQPRCGLGKAAATGSFVTIGCYCLACAATNHHWTHGRIISCLLANWAILLAVFCLLFQRPEPQHHGGGKRERVAAAAAATTVASLFVVVTFGTVRLDGCLFLVWELCHSGQIGWHHIADYFRYSDTRHLTYVISLHHNHLWPYAFLR